MLALHQETSETTASAERFSAVAPLETSWDNSAYHEWVLQLLREKTARLLQRGLHPTKYTSYVMSCQVFMLPHQP